MAWVFFALFLLFELCIAAEPVLAPSLLKQKVPVLVGLSNFLVSTCNFAVTYFFPMWFQTVMLTRASIAGEWHFRLQVFKADIFKAFIFYRTVCRCHWDPYSRVG